MSVDQNTVRRIARLARIAVADGSRTHDIGHSDAHDVARG
jgi:Asp-tRNA(Asn)/Glu-tRNA(Gln) amidotransferase C subunit